MSGIFTGTTVGMGPIITSTTIGSTTTFYASGVISYFDFPTYKIVHDTSKAYFLIYKTTGPVIIHEFPLNRLEDYRKLITFNVVAVEDAQKWADDFKVERL